MKTILALLFVLAAASLPSASAAAQQPREARGRPQAATLVVTVVDDSTGRPLEGARARVLEHPALERSGEDGVVRLARVPAGARVLQVTLPGYRMSRRQVEVGPETAPLTVRMVAQVDEVRLEGLRVTSWGRSRQLVGSGFYERQRAWRGSFMTADEIFARRPTRLRDLFHTLRGFRVVPKNGNDLLLATRAAGGGGSCAPAAYLDGMPTDVNTIMTMSPDDVEGIEAYPSLSSIPPQYSGRMACAAVLVWTKR